MGSRIKYDLESRRGPHGETQHYAKVPLEEVLQLDANKLGILQRIGRFFTGKAGQVDPETTTEMPTGMGTSGLTTHTTNWYERLKLEHTRQARYNDYRRMDEESGLLWKAANVITGDAFGSPETGDAKESFASTTDDKAVQAVLEGVDKRLALKTEAKSVARSAVVMGDDFEELVFRDEKQGEIVRVKHLPCRMTSRNEDEFGRFTDINRAFTYTPDGSMDGVGLTWWQVVHVRHEHRRGNMYGTSMFHGARRAFRLLHPMEEGVAIERLVNAGDRLVFYVPVPKGSTPDQRRIVVNQAVDSYRRKLTVDSSGRVDLSKIPVAENVDIFMGVEDGANGRVERLAGSRAVGVLSDLEYFQNEMIAATGVPKAYLGIERDVNAKATLSWQDIQYARGVRVLQGEIATQFVRPIYDRELFVRQMRGAEYFVEYPAVSSVDEEVRATIAQAKWAVAQIARSAFGAPTEWCLRELVGLEEEQIEDFIKSPDYEKQTPQAAAGRGAPEMPARGVPGARETASVREQVSSNRALAAKLAEVRDLLQAVHTERLMQPLRVAGRAG